MSVSITKTRQHMRGVVYCLTNPAMPHYVKIGMTQNLTNRLKQLDNTSMPLPFECAYAVEVPEPRLVEKLLHDVFDDQRTRRSREFFETSPERVIAAMKLTGGTDVTPIDDTVEDADAQKALNKARARRAAFNFKMVGVKPGSALVFFDDEHVTCIVKDHKTVEFEDEVLTLSRAAAKVLIARRKAANQPIPAWLEQGSVQGPIYWCFDDESLNERRNRLESTD